VLEADEMATIDRVATVMRWLYEGQTVTILRVANDTGLSRQGAWYLLSRLSSTIHIYNHDGEWKLLDSR
jgi:hypothetical protein